MLDTGYWMLDAGCLPAVTQADAVAGRLDTGYWMLDAGYWILDTGYWILDAGCWILDGFVPIVPNTNTEQGTPIYE